MKKEQNIEGINDGNRTLYAAFMGRRSRDVSSFCNHVLFGEGLMSTGLALLALILILSLVAACSFFVARQGLPALICLIISSLTFWAGAEISDDKDYVKPHLSFIDPPHMSDR